MRLWGGCAAAVVLFIAASGYAMEPWEESEHGRMLKRVLPPGPAPTDLPEAGSSGAHLLERYCVQCHYLPDPRMHSPKHWPHVVDRMVRRMRGEGNIGEEMKDLMHGVEAPHDDEAAALTAYLRRHGQQPIEAARYRDLDTPEGRAFSEACSQCHALPDPKRHTANEWPKVVERMQKHLAWVGVISSNRSPTAPRLSVEKITEFLRRNSAR